MNLKNRVEEGEFTDCFSKNTFFTRESKQSNGNERVNSTEIKNFKELAMLVRIIKNRKEHLCFNNITVYRLLMCDDMVMRNPAPIIPWSAVQSFERISIKYRK